MKHVDIVIVGAGISGLMAASTIMESSNASVQMIDKGQRPGGRLATRRIAGNNFDTGAQFITASSDIFRTIIESWLNQGWITPWYSEDRLRYAAVGGMNQLAERLAYQQQLECSTVIESIASHNNKYIVLARNTNTNTTQQWTAKSVLLTCPIPQVFPILESGDISIDSNIRNQLHGVKYKPCLAVMVCMGEEAIGLLPQGILREPFPGIISWIADNRSKGISEAPSWTIHLDSDWSERHFNDTDIDIWKYVLPYIENIQGGPITLELEYQIKRWRFAKAHQLISVPYLDIGVGAPLVLSGDVFASSHLPNKGGAKVENAVLSGIAAGQYIAKMVERD